MMELNFRFHVSPISIDVHQSSEFGELKALMVQLAASLQTFKDQVMSALTDLQAAVAAENTVIDSAVTLLQGLKAALDAAIASGDPAALTALSADIGAKTQALSDAVQANTPATP